MSQAEMDPGRAIAIVACHAVAVAWSDANAKTYGMWEDYPDIGERDWSEVVDHARGVAAVLRGTSEEFKTAYAVLAARAGGEA